MQSFHIEPLTAARKAARLRRGGLAVLAASLALLILATPARLPKATGDAGADLRTVTVAIGDIESTVLASATLQAVNQVNIGAQVSGQVQSLKVTLGQEVGKGDLIAEIDATPQKNELRNAEAALKSQEAQLRAKQIALRLAESALQRQRVMLERDASSRADYESAEATRDMARAETAALEAQIEQARIQADKVRFDLGRAAIRAPMGGTVIAIVTKEGQTLNSAQQVPTIVRLARLDTLQVKAQISEVDVARVKAGQAVYFTLMGNPGRRYHARLEVVEPVPDGANQEAPAGGGGAASAVYYNALFSVPNPDGGLRIGMTAQVSVVLARASQVVTVARAALGEPRPDGRYVVRVLKEGRFETREVRAGLGDHLNIQILDGLKAGERVLPPDGPAPDAASADAA
ncbi:efflux RND transporter periplasmic adaptor subunit [Pseudoduganella namucuonensis]|nr:efflux RND transporter periplasmic adaptor subunit [Pseudoduganella namucuonensis]